MSWFVLVLWILLAAAVPDLCPRAFGLATHAPDLWVAFVVYAACRGRGYAAVGWGILLGLVRDAQSLDPLGTHGFVLGLVGFLFAEGRTDRGRVQGLARTACTFLAVVAAGWAYLLRVLPLGEGLALLPFLDVFPTALFTALAVGPLYALTDRFHALDDLLGRRRGLPA
jgi:rod shape-determining protein MreD